MPPRARADRAVTARPPAPARARLRAAVAAALLGLAATVAPAAGPATAASAPAAAASAPADEPIIETTRRAVQETTEWLARGVDSWFGDRPFDKGGSVSDGRLRLGLLHRRDQGTDADVRLNARFRLPNVERNAYVLVGRDNEREVISDQPSTLSRQQRLAGETSQQQGFFAGLGITLREAFDLRLGLRGGLKPYAQARYAKPWELTPSDRLDFRQTFFWSLDDRLGSTSVLSYEHFWSPTFEVRWLSAATITQRSRRYEWSSVIGGYRLLGPQCVLAVEGLLLGAEHTGVAFSDYGVRVRLEQPVYKDWLLGELILGHFWPRPDAASPRGRAWAVGAGLTLRF